MTERDITSERETRRVRKRERESKEVRRKERDRVNETERERRTCGDRETSESGQAARPSHPGWRLGISHLPGTSANGIPLKTSTE